MDPYQPAVTSNGEHIALFGVEDLDDGRVVALGVFTPIRLARGRVLKTRDGRRLKTTTALPAGLSLDGGPPGFALERPLVLLAKGRGPKA